MRSAIPSSPFGSLGRLVRHVPDRFRRVHRHRRRVDQEGQRRLTPPGLSRAHCAVGRITYANGSRGYLIYLEGESGRATRTSASRSIRRPIGNSRTKRPAISSSRKISSRATAGLGHRRRAHGLPGRRARRGRIWSSAGRQAGPLRVHCQRGQRCACGTGGADALVRGVGAVSAAVGYS